MKNITKKTQTILFASLIVAMILPFSTMDFAEAQTDDQNRVNKKIVDIENNKKAYQKLVEKETKLLDKIAQLEHDGTSKLQNKLDAIYEEMDVLQQNNYELFSIPADKLDTLITAKENVKKSLVEGDLINSFVDYKKEELVFVQNTESVKNLSISEKVETKEKLDKKIKANANGQKYRLDSVEDKRHSSNCLARSNNCNPNMGGLKVKVSTNPGAWGTEGFAADRFGVDGFVITSHQTNDQTGGTVYQYTATAGTVTDVQDSLCDCAFVANTSSDSTEDKIWISSYGRFSITSHASSSDHGIGTFLKKSGVASYVTSGSIYANTGNFVYADIYSIGGDSGSPVYAGSGSSGKLYGLLWGGPVSAPTDTIYTKYHVIDSYLSLD